MDEAALIEVDVEQRMAGLGHYVLADLDQLVPVDVLEVVGLVTRLSEVVGPVEETDHAGIERQRV